MAADKPASIKPAKLKAAFQKDLAAAWIQARTLHPDHTPYAFVLYGMGGYPELTPHVLTEESLTVVAERLFKDGFLDTLAEAREGLRYSTPDSPHFSELAESLVTVNAMMAPFKRRINETAGYELLGKTAMAALQELDKQGCFGGARERDELLLLVITDDTEVDWLRRSAKRLNSTAAFRRLENALRAEGTYRASSGLAVSRDGSSLYSVGERELNRKTQEKISEVVAYDISELRLKRRWGFSFPSSGLSGKALTCTRDNATLLVLSQKYGGSRPEAFLTRFAHDKNKPLQERRWEDGEPQSLALAHDNSQVAVIVDKTVHILDENLSDIRSVELDTRPRIVHFLSSGELLIASGTGVLKMDTACNVARTAHTRGCNALAVDDAETLLLVGGGFHSGQECGVEILSLPTLAPVRTVLIPKHHGTYPCISPDGRLLAFEAQELESLRKSVVLFETSTGREIARRKSDITHSLRFLRDNRTLAIAQSVVSKSEPILLWRLPSLLPE
jgi:hypothetical protein